MTDLHCGRLDPHAPHDWSVPRSPHYLERKTFECTGAPLIEGGWAAWDLADDAAEEQAIRERRETA